MLLLADDFFFVAHDSINLKRRLSDRVVRLGLAGALVGEQVLFRRITLRDGQIRVVNRTPPPDALAHTVLDHLLAEPDVTAVQDWLRFFARDAYEKVAQRLIREGHVHVREERRFLRVVTVLDPASTTRSGWPESRLASRLSAGAVLEFPDVVLAGLVAATGLDAYVLADTPPQARSYLRHAVATLPPSLREVVNQTAAAVGDAVLNART